MSSSRLRILLPLLVLFTGCLLEDEPVMSLPDTDGDGIPDLRDVFPEDPLEWRDNDLDGTGDNADEDDDNDGYNDTVELELATNPFDNISMPPDNDRDFVPDVWDPDDDNDCYTDEMEVFDGSDPLNGSSLPPDNDLDCFSDGVDWDDDNDSVTDDDDAFPFDPAASADGDGDGMPEWWRPGFSAVSSTTNLTLDPFPDDYDNDAVPDDSDDFPRDPAASIDSDKDGYPNRWNQGYTAEDSTTGLELDQLPENARFHAWWQIAIPVLLLMGATYFARDIRPDGCTNCGSWFHFSFECRRRRKRRSNYSESYYDHYRSPEQPDAEPFDDYAEADLGCGYCGSTFGENNKCPNWDMAHANFFFDEFTGDFDYSGASASEPALDYTPEQLKTLDKALKVKRLYDDARKDEGTFAQNEAQAALNRYTRLLSKAGLSTEDLRLYQEARERDA